MPTRRRLSRDARHRQLLETSWQLVHDDGTEALTLGRLALRAGVAKPVVYSHFPTRRALLAALYRDFDLRQIARIADALGASEPTLGARAAVIASTCLACVLAQGREIPGVIAALASAPELEEVRRSCEAVYLAIVREALAPFVSGGALPQAPLRAMMGAAEALSCAAANGELAADEAEAELCRIVVAMVERSARD